MKRNGMLLVSVLVCVAAPTLIVPRSAPAPAHAQGVAPPEVIAVERRVDWSGAGVTGGIPPRGTGTCASLNASATADEINAAIAACSAGGVVYLNAGTYHLT